MQAGKKFDTAALKQFLNEQEDFVAHMNREVVEDDLVTPGIIDDSHLLTGRAVKKEQPKQISKRKRFPSLRPRMVRNNRGFKRQPLNFLFLCFSFPRSS